MWRPLSNERAKLRESAAANERTFPKFVAAFFATIIFIAALFGIAYLDQRFGSRSSMSRSDAPYSLQNASMPALLSIFGATVMFMYFLFVKNRRAPVIYICYDCQEAFHAQTTCPACKSSRVADIRNAEWVE